jgi:sporulation-control protein spo0M
MSWTSLDDIFKQWEIDSKIDPIILHSESLHIAQLQCKYQKLLANERIYLLKLEYNYKLLYRQKYEFLTQGPTEKTEELEWKLPPRGCVLKADVAMYLESDLDLDSAQQRLTKCKECIRVLEDILKSLSQRSFNIKNAIDFIKFQAGE